MAAKTIGAKIVLEGEKEYKQALKDISTQQKELRSEMTLAAAQYKDEQNSIEALTAKHEILAKQIETQQSKVDLYAQQLEKANDAQSKAAEDMDKYTQELADAQAELEKMTEAGTASNEEMDAQKQKISELNQALGTSEQQYQAAGQKVSEYQTNLNLAQADLANLNSALNENDKYLEEAKNSTDGTAQSMLELGKDSQSAGDIIKDLGSKLSLAVGAASAAAVAEVAKNMSELALNTSFWADTLNTLSTQTGLSTDMLQRLYYVEELLDVSVETVTGAMTKNIKSMANARDGSEKYVDAYEKVGVAVEDANGQLRDSDEVFWEVIDALGEFTNEAERDAAAMQIFGRSAQSLKTLIAAGSEGFRELSEEAEDLGYVIDDKTLKALNQLSDSSERVNKKFDALKNSMGVAFAPAVTNLYEGLNDLLNALMGVGSKADSMATNFEKAQKAMASQNAEIDSNAGKAKALADRLTELNSKTERTAAEQAEMAGTVRALNKLYPDLKLSIDEYTGALQGSTDSIYNNIDAMVEQAKQAANLEHIQDLAEQLAEAETAREDALVRLTAAQAEYDAKLKESIELGNAAAENLDVMGAGVYNANEALSSANDELSSAKGAVESLDTTIAGLNTQLDEYRAKTDEAAESTEEVVESAEMTEEELEELANKYVDVKIKAVESLTSQVGLFQELKTESKYSLDEMKSNLESQTNVYNQYAEDLAVAERTWGANNAGLLKSIESLGIDGAAYLKQLNDAYTESNEAFAGVADAFKAMDEARNQLGSVLAEIKTGYGDTIDEILATSETAAEAMAENSLIMVENVTDAISDEKPNTVTAIETLYDELEEATNTKLDITDGVSNVYMGVGALIPDSMKEGLESHKSNFFQAVDKMFDELTEKMIKKMKEAISKADKEIGKAVS